MKIRLATAFAIFILFLAVPAAPQDQGPGTANAQNGATIPAPGAKLPPETAGSEVLQNNNPGGSESSSSTGSTCQVSFGSCPLSAPAPLGSKCECNTLQFGEIAGWVVK